MIDWFSQLDPNLQTDIWVVSVGAMTNVACALLGCYLVLRRMSLLGDALAHAVLPGLVVAFILSGSLGIVYMMVGALIVGILTTVLIETLHRYGGVSEDSSMGVVFTSLFALGIVLVKRYGSAVDLDADCVLNGLLEMVDLNTVEIAGRQVPRALVTIGPVLLLNIGFIVLFWKELLFSSFDAALATTMGFKSGLMHYLLMALVALTTVASFEQVGSILVIAMLIVPGATAHLLTDRLSRMLWISAGIGVLSAVLGYWLAQRFDTNIAGMMSVVVGLFYLAAALFSPHYGVISSLLRNLQMAVRIVREDLLAMLYRLEELSHERQMSAREATQAVGGGTMARFGLWALLRKREVRRDGAGLVLTDDGRARATQLVRSHRLWEAYLVKHLGLPLDHVHEPATRMEHFIDQELSDRLAEDLGEASTDPHGRDIPPG